LKESANRFEAHWLFPAYLIGFAAPKRTCMLRPVELGTHKPVIPHSDK
jgi:hypothetical protein